MKASKDIKYSIVVPNYNGIQFAHKLIRAFRQQLFSPLNYEVLIVDNGSNDGSKEVFEKLIENIENFQILSYTESQSSYAARNFGVRYASSDILIFTDADCMPRPDWLSNVDDAIDRCSGEFLISGKVKLFPEGDEWNISEWYDLKFFLAQEDYSKTQTGATANLIVSKPAYDRVNGFLPLGSGGDRDFCKRVMDAGATEFIYCPDILVMHPARSSPKEIKKKLVRVAEGIASLEFRRANRMTKWLVLLKLTLAFTIQPHHFKKAIATLVDLGFLSSKAWRYSFNILRMGWYQRWYILRFYTKNLFFSKLPN